jgi:hypothetical protein
MAKAEPQLDVLVLGEHPAAYLAAALVRNKSKLRVVHATIPDERLPDRLVVINPSFFSLHPLLEGLKRKLDLSPVYGLQFLSDETGTRSEHRSKTVMAHVGSFKDVRHAVVKIAQDQGVELVTPKVLHVHRLDEGGLDVTLGKGMARPKVLVLGGKLPDEQEKLLGLPDAWEANVVHRYTFARVKAGKAVDLGGKPAVPMSLDLAGQLFWAWMLPHDGQVQFAVQQPVESAGQYPPAEMLRHWVGVLHKHGVLKAVVELAPNAIESVDLPLAGALAHEGVANRTLLVGPAGGFFSACSEDIYPNCWSAVHAADSVKKALKEVHLQDAIAPYRHRWRTTLGDYLRGPQQNLRFLLPLVYRNQVMTTRLAESILQGKSVVR